MTHQVLIASYAKDFPWLRCCLRSLKRFSRGFLPPVVSVTSADFPGCRALADQVFPEAQVVVKDEAVRGMGNIRAQISMMSGDLLCPQADYVYLVGSDCLIWDTFTPEQWFSSGKPTMLYSSYAVIGKTHPAVFHWQHGTARVVGFVPEHEYMRRLPLVYPKSLFPNVRRHIESVHKTSFESFCYSFAKPGNLCNSGFSESNIMGAFAFKYMPELYHWASTDGGWPRYHQPLIQFYSHGGFDRPTDAYVEYSGGLTHGKTPRQIITEILGSI